MRLDSLSSERILDSIHQVRRVLVLQQLALCLLFTGGHLVAQDASPSKGAANPTTAKKSEKKSQAGFNLDGATKIPFKETPQGNLHLHMFKPEGWDPNDSRAAIVFFFGGGWVGGTPKQFEPQCLHLADRGMVAITAEYRVRSRHNVHPADCVADAKDAVRYVRSHFRELGIDNSRIAVAGGSAGGHVAASTATLGRLPEESETNVTCTPNALVLYNPVCDTSMLGYGGKRLAKRMFELSPAHHIRPHMPPTLIFHGKADKTVPFENARRFTRLMNEAGNACELVAYLHAGHGFFNRGRKNSEYVDTTRRLDDFLTKLGYLPPISATPIAGRTLEQWLTELGSSDATKQRRAAESIGQFGTLASDHFVKMLDHDDDAIRYIGATNIGHHRSPKTAVNRLRSIISRTGDSRGVRIAAAYALCRLGELDAGLPILEAAMLVKERGTACSAAEFAGLVGPDASPLAEMMQAERDKQANRGDYHIRGALTNALRKIRQDKTLTAHKRPTGGGKPRGWQPSEKPNPANFIATPKGQKPESRPNILWISCEDISPNLGCYGDTYARTPNLDRLASEGVRFDRAFTPAGVCAVMRSGHITGVYPISQGTHHMRSNVVLPTGVRCFPEYLRAAGYFCTNKSKTDYQFTPPATVWDRQGNQHNDWRDRAPGQPFFSVINLTCSHESQIRHGQKTHAAVLDRLSANQRHDPDAAGEHLPPIYPNTPEARKDWAWYADNISEMDRQAGLILQQLKEDGLSDNTIVVFWGDHGRGLPRAKRWIYDSGIHVPFLIRWPGHVQPSTVRGDLVSTQDLAPTMLSVAGIEVPDYMQGRVIVGDQTDDEPEYLFFHRDRMDEAYELMRAARDRRFKYIRNYRVGRTYAQNIDYMNMMPTLVDLRQMQVDGQLTQAQARFFRSRKPHEELYDLEKDPHETVNLAWLPEHQKRVAKMRSALENWQDEVVDLGLVPEPVLMEQMRPGDEVAQVAQPTVDLAVQNGNLTMSLASKTEGASLQYRITSRGAKNTSWKIYSKPVVVQPGDKIDAVACRAGFKDSDVSQQTIATD